MNTKNFTEICKKPLATVHCSCGDWKITGLCAMAVGALLVWHVMMCVCIKCSMAHLKKKSCGCGCTAEEEQ